MDNEIVSDPFISQPYRLNGLIRPIYYPISLIRSDCNLYASVVVFVFDHLFKYVTLIDRSGPVERRGRTFLQHLKGTALGVEEN
jgi:hypothetical protein